jgi:hypothetical protein
VRLAAIIASGSGERRSGLPVGDLVSRLLEAIEQVERAAPDVHHLDCQKVHPAYAESAHHRGKCTCGEPDRIRQRCARDRGIVDVYRGAESQLQDVLAETEGDPWESSTVMAFKRSLKVWGEVVQRTAIGYGLEVTE